MFERTRGLAVDLGYAAGWSVVKARRRRACPAGRSAPCADAATVRNGGGVQQLRKNLRRVVGPNVSELRMDQLVGDALRSYSRYWLETFRLPKMDIAERGRAGRLRRRSGASTSTTAVDAGQGRHPRAAAPGQLGRRRRLAGRPQHGPFATVAERLKPESLFDRFVAYRESLGFEVLALTGGDRGRRSQFSPSGCEANKVICLLADRDLSRNGIEVDFFGEPTRMPGGPAMFAARTGAALLPVSLWFTPDGGWGQRINSPVVLPDAIAARPGRARRPKRWPTRFAERHRRAPGRLAHAAEALARRPGRPHEPPARPARA